MIGNFFGRLGPYVYDLIIFFTICNPTLRVLVLKLSDLCVSPLDDTGLGLWNDHVFHGYGDAGFCCEMESQIFETVRQHNSLLVSSNPVTIIDQCGQFLLFHDFID